MTLILVSASWSRRQSVKAFNAAFEAEYAGKVTAGTMARWEPVLFWSASVDSILRWGFSQYNTCVGLLAQEEGQESMHKDNETGEIDVDLGVEGCDVYRVWFWEVIFGLNTSVQKEAIDIRGCSSDAENRVSGGFGSERDLIGLTRSQIEESLPYWQDQMLLLRLCWSRAC